jgi:hypothetical protein
MFKNGGSMLKAEINTDHFLCEYVATMITLSRFLNLLVIYDIRQNIGKKASSA